MSERATLPPLPTLKRIPCHVAIIMDGNGRWAQMRGLPRTAGHRAGAENLREVVKAAIEFGIEQLTIYAFSTENWARPMAEVRALLALAESVLDNRLQELHEAGVRLRHLGRTEGLPQAIVTKIARAEELTAGNTRLGLNIAFNYGGRAEIVDAFKALMAEGLSPEAIDEQTISDHLTTRGLPDPDLVIRTAREMRLSNFLIWQAAYAEYYSTEVLWPDFGREDLYEALAAFQNRHRRFGRLEPDGN
ncbi:MAG: isoprenyl transferase [Anaerolineae bacterium]|nr:isoprenyl transferase [Anaerolineae bacterium]